MGESPLDTSVHQPTISQDQKAFGRCMVTKEIILRCQLSTKFHLILLFILVGHKGDYIPRETSIVWNFNHYNLQVWVQIDV